MSAKLFVRGVDLDLTSTDEVAEYFAQKGRVTEVLTRHQPSGAVVVAFDSADDAIRGLALDGTVMHTMSQSAMLLKVRPFNPAPAHQKPNDFLEKKHGRAAAAPFSPPKPPAPLPQPPPNCVFVSKLDWNCTEAELSHLFRAAGELDSVEPVRLLPLNRGNRGQCAIVAFAAAAGADRALSVLHGALMTPAVAGAPARRILVEAYKPNWFDGRVVARPGMGTETSHSLSPAARPARTLPEVAAAMNLP